MKRIRIENLYKGELQKGVISKAVLDERLRVAKELLPVAKKGVRARQKKCVRGPLSRSHQAAWAAAEAMQRHFG